MSFCVAVLAVMPLSLYGQVCDATLCGTVLDAASGHPIPFAEVFIQETGGGGVADVAGRFHIHGLCEGTYTVDCRHIGCQSISKEIFISGNVEVDFDLSHEATHLDEIVVREKALRPISTQTEHKLDAQELAAKQGQTLAELLKDLPGVNILKTGNTISKPVVQGLHSNRVLMLNHGVRQEGQQWGLDHGPEIDPYTAGEISVVTGANSVRYGVDAVGGVILVAPKPLPKQPGISGELNLAGFSNGRTGVVSGFLESHKKLANGTSRWFSRVQGTLKRGGNYRTPDYFLENTGVKETNSSATFGFDAERFNGEVFYSYFFTELGIFEGAHIGNLTDLLQAIDRGRPTGDGSFSYQLGRPAQKVAHHLLKTKGEWRANNIGNLSMVYARQFNRRQEFDAHSPGGNLPEGLVVPSLEFEITTHTIDLVLEHRPMWRRFTGSFGVQLMQQVNTTDRGGLIPDFDSQTAGVFWIERWRKYPFPLELEIGARYDVRRLYAERRGAEIIDQELDFGNFSGTVGSIYRFSDFLRAKFHFGTAWRAPTVNELYSDGVHHGSASYELGRSNLQSERAFSTNLSIEMSKPQNGDGQSLNASLSFYRNSIKDFIYLAPQEQPVLTIRGAFPAFRYEQTDARLSGLDWNFDWQFHRSFGLSSGISLLRAKDVSADEWLIYMPSDRLRHGIQYTWMNREPEHNPIKGLSEANLKFTMQNVFEQKRVPKGVDYADPPPSYTLFDIEAGLEMGWHGQPLFMTLAIENIFNTSYRDYLNRLRYYADEQGRNVSVRINLKF